MKQRKKCGDTWRQEHLFTCSCGTFDHILGVHWFEDDKDTAYILLSIHRRSFLRRIQEGFNHIFRRKPIEVQELLMTKQSMKKIRDGINIFLKP